MLQRILTWTLIAALWRRYGKILRILPIVIAILVVITMLHDDYVQYVKVSEDAKFLQWSFLVKWLLILLVVGVYWQFAKTMLNRDQQKEIKKEPKNRSTKRNENSADTSNLSGVDSENDPFSNIRQKKALRSKAEVVLEKKL